MDTEGVIDFQIGLEERISKIYNKIADLFSADVSEHRDWISLWRALSVDEQNHATLLSIEKAFLQTGAHVKRPIDVDPKTREAFEVLLARCEARIQSGMTQKEAIDILTNLEGSEVNARLSKILKATDSRILVHMADYSRSQMDHDRRIQTLVRKYGGH